jgi:hypothetical protein
MTKLRDDAIDSNLRKMSGRYFSLCFETCVILVSAFYDRVEKNRSKEFIMTTSRTPHPRLRMYP